MPPSPRPTTAPRDRRPPDGVSGDIAPRDHLASARGIAGALIAPLPAFVLAGGLGLRLRPVTGAAPKSLASVGGRPFLEYVLDHLATTGIRDVTLCTGHGATAIAAAIGAGERFGLRVRYSPEPEPLGTAGAIRLAFDRTGVDRALVLNGDSFFDIELGALAAAHARLGGLVTFALREVPDSDRYGTVALDADGTVLAFREKGAAGPGLINAGTYVLERSALDTVVPGTAVSLERDVFPRLVDAGRRDRARRIAGVPFDGYFIDIGVPEDHARADRDPSPLRRRSARC